MSGRRGHASTVCGALIALCWLAASGPAWAQTATNTSGLEGKVTDESGAILPGVTVTISSPALQAPQLDTVTDETGRYRFSALPRGVYKVTFTLSGFQKVTREGLNIDAGFVASLDPKLAVGALEESVTVVGDSPVIDVRTTTVVSSIKKDVLETLPTSRSYEDMGKLAPGIRVSGVPDVGGNHTGGGRGSLVNYGSTNGGSTLMLDGINTDGTAGYYDMGAVDEMIVNAAGNDPEIATPGMAFQVIIKSGGNSFHGDGLYAFQTRSLQGNNIDDYLRSQNITGNPMDGYYDANGSLGGRILRDRLWFFGSIRRKEYRQELIGFAGGPGPDDKYYTADDEQGLTTDRESNLVGKLQGRLTNKQTLSYMRHYNYKKQDNRAGGSFIPHESAGDYELPNTVHVLEYTGVAQRSVAGAAGGGPELLEVARRPVHRQRADLRQRDAALRRRLRELGRLRFDAGRQLQQPLAIRRQLHLLQAVVSRRRTRDQGRRRVHARVVQQVPGSARRRHRRRRQRLPADLLQRRAVPGPAVQLTVRRRKQRQLPERLRARHHAHRRPAHVQRRRPDRALPRVSSGAGQAGGTLLRRGVVSRG